MLLCMVISCHRHSLHISCNISTSTSTSTSTCPKIPKFDPLRPLLVLEVLLLLFSLSLSLSPHVSVSASLSNVDGMLEPPFWCAHLALSSGRKCTGNRTPASPSDRGASQSLMTSQHPAWRSSGDGSYSQCSMLSDPEDLDGGDYRNPPQQWPPMMGSGRGAVLLNDGGSVMTVEPHKATDGDASNIPRDMDVDSLSGGAIRPHQQQPHHVGGHVQYQQQQQLHHHHQQ